jgi:chromosome partitioning protein
LSRDIVEMLEDTARGLRSRVFNTKIREAVAVREAQAHRKSLFDYAPKSTAAQDYLELIEESLRAMNVGE